MEIEIRWKCTKCNYNFASDDLLPVCPVCNAAGDNIIGLELEDEE